MPVKNCIHEMSSNPDFTTLASSNPFTNYILFWKPFLSKGAKLATSKILLVWPLFAKPVTYDHFRIVSIAFEDCLVLHLCCNKQMQYLCGVASMIVSPEGALSPKGDKAPMGDTIMLPTPQRCCICFIIPKNVIPCSLVISSSPTSLKRPAAWGAAITSN